MASRFRPDSPVSPSGRCLRSRSAHCGRGRIGPPHLAGPARSHRGRDDRRVSLGLRAGQADVMLTYLTALGLLERVGDEVTPTALGLDHLAAGSPYDLRRPCLSSVRERPGCAELLAVLRSGQPAAWASADERRGLGRTARQLAVRRADHGGDGCRGNFLGPVLADALHDLPVRRLSISAEVPACTPSPWPPGCRLPARSSSGRPVDAAARTLLAPRAERQPDRDVGETCSPARYQPASTCRFSHVLHDWDEDQRPLAAHRLLRGAATRRLLVDHDVHINATETGPLRLWEFFGILLVHSTPGKCWSTSELTPMLQEAGFACVTCRRTAADRSAVIAQKPSARSAVPDPATS